MPLAMFSFRFSNVITIVLSGRSFMVPRILLELITPCQDASIVAHNANPKSLKFLLAFVSSVLEQMNQIYPNANIMFPLMCSELKHLKKESYAQVKW